jgi:TIGR03009 family protein
VEKIMRILAIIALMGLGVNVAVAQNPPPQAGQPPAQQPTPQELQQKLDSILQLWETDAKSLQALYVNFAIEEKDDSRGFMNVKKLFGEAKVLRLPTGHYALRLEISDVDAAGNPIPGQVRSKYICSGTWLYNFDIANRTITYNQLNNTNMKPDDGPFAFLFGMKATDAVKRFQMEVVQEDQHYMWLRVVALTDQDKRDFTMAQLGVVKDAYPTCPKGFPAQIMYRDPAKSLKTWFFKQVIRNDLSKVTMADFSVEAEKKAGWKFLPAPQQTSATPANQGQVIPASGNQPPRK